MNTQRPLTPLERDRAVARLRRMTVGTALAGIAAVAGFGTVAAITFPGHTGASATDVSGAVSAVTGTSASQATTGGSVADSLFAAPTLSPSRSSGSAQVVTGGS